MLSFCAVIVCLWASLAHREHENAKHLYGQGLEDSDFVL